MPTQMVQEISPDNSPSSTPVKGFHPPQLRYLLPVVQSPLRADQHLVSYRVFESLASLSLRALGSPVPINIIPKTVANEMVIMSFL